MLTPFAKLLRLTLLLALMGATGCSLLAPKPEVIDTREAVLGPIDPELQQGFSEALVLLRDEEYAEAEALLIELTSKFPAFAGPWSNLAIAQSQQEKYAEALISIDKSLAEDESFCQAVSLRGVVLRELGQFKQAKEQYLAALKCNPEDALSLYNLGVLSDLYLHDEVAALGYYQQYLITQGEYQDETVRSWVVDLKRRVPAEAITDAEPEVSTEAGAESNKQLEVNKSEPQLAGEEL
jgi:tetratricopeptide (TPR) repeat protein